MFLQGKPANEDNIYHITFINDNYIYCSDLNEYFNYINTHDLDLCSYTDSTENIYHYQFYLFTIKITNLNKCINFNWLTKLLKLKLSVSFIKALESPLILLSPIVIGNNIY